MPDRMDEEHEVYGGEIPQDVEGDMDAEMDGNPEDAMLRSEDGINDDAASKELEEMKRRLKEMEEEAAALRDMQAKVEKEMGAVQDPTGTGGQDNREEPDARSVFVGNVDYSCTPEEVQQHFQSCGTVNRVTILTDKFGQPKGYRSQTRFWMCCTVLLYLFQHPEALKRICRFAYVEFVEAEAVQNAILLNESELHGRQLKVAAKRTNVPGMKQFRGRHFNPYYAYRPRRPYFPPYALSPYGRIPRFRCPIRYRPY